MPSRTAAGLIKLDAMENPFVAAAGTAAPSWAERLGRRGHQPLSRCRASADAGGGAGCEVRRAARAGCKMILGNGSDELISTCSAMACDRAGRDACWRRCRASSCTQMSAQLQRAELRRCAADRPTSSWTRPAMLAAIEQHRPAHDLHRLPEQPDGQPVRRRGIDRAHRFRGGSPARAGGVRRGLPAVFVAQRGWHEAWPARACAGDAHAQQVRPGGRAAGLPVSARRR